MPNLSSWLGLIVPPTLRARDQRLAQPMAAFGERQSAKSQPEFFYKDGRLSGRQPVAVARDDVVKAAFVEFGDEVTHLCPDIVGHLVK